MARPGELIGDKYRLVRLLEEGGMAAVWEAEQVALETRVAVKLLSVDGGWLSGSRTRFLEEARIAAGVKHRNVVQTLDFGATDDGTPFIVMELLEGESLADRVAAEAPMSVEDALALVDQILGALAAAHAVGIVHRDLKPENVLFTRDTDGSYPKLIDFGISKDLAPTRDRDPSEPGMILGTPEFMAPEQAAGLATVDHRADLYAVGIVLYEMLSGELPYEGDDPNRVRLQVLRGGAPTLRERGVDVPVGLSDAVARAMAIEPSARFEDAESMRAALRALRPGAAPPPSRRPLRIPDLDPRDPERASSRGRWTLAALAGLLLLLIPAALWVRAWIASPDPAPVAAGSADAGPSDVDGALRRADDHTIYVHLRELPDGATVSLDGEVFSAAQLASMRRGDVVEVPVPRRRGRAFTLRVAREGYEDWRMRRWTVRDFEARVVMVPILE